MKKIFINKNKSQNTKDKTFFEFFPKSYSVEEFFEIYNELFYDLPKFQHEIIVDQSKKYIGTPPDPKDQEIEDLEKQINDLKFKIRSFPVEHPIFKNGKVIALGTTSVKNGASLYYIQNRRLRPIANRSVLNKIKINNGFPPSFSDESFVLRLSEDAIGSFQIVGYAPINNEEDLLLSETEINNIQSSLNSIDFVDGDKLVSRS